MYQFNQMFSELGVKVTRKSYRWWGLAAGIFGGWLPAWGLSHWQAWGWLPFLGIWIGAMPAGYYLGKLIKK